MTRPLVDIVIPFHGHYESVTKCVSSITNCTPNQKYKIILVDDASPNKDYLPTMTANRSVVPVRLDNRSGFGAALEKGFNSGDANHVVFMHSDVYVENIYWLANMQRCLYDMKDKGVKLVSARTNDPGSCVYYDPRLIGEQEANIGGDSIVDAPLPLFCSLCHRELFKRIGGFVKNYPYAWYEDEELFWRMRYYKYHQAIASKSYVKHDGGLTVRSLLETSPKLLPILEGNRDLCVRDTKLYVSRKSPAGNPQV